MKPSPIAEIDKDCKMLICKRHFYKEGFILASICLVQCEVKGVHRRAADGRFVYIVEVGLCVMLILYMVCPPYLCRSNGQTTWYIWSVERMVNSLPFKQRLEIVNIYYCLCL